MLSIILALLKDGSDTTQTTICCCQIYSIHLGSLKAETKICFVAVDALLVPVASLQQREGLCSHRQR
jgi:hypothetical protein